MKKLISGKVREVYEVSNDKLVIVTTDRISAFDVILPMPVTNKGKVLNAVSLFWFDFTKDIIPNHIISGNLKDMPEYFQKSEFEGRAVLVKKLKILPFEFIVRGYMFGNMWAAYSKGGEFCGQKIKEGYKLAEKLDAPLFTPSTKAHTGHDEYITVKYVADTIGAELADKTEKVCFELYKACYAYAYSKNIIIADTKFEFGLDENNNLFLADEVFTPDSSRFWSLSGYQAGSSPKSYDKQLVRDWLLNNKKDGEMQFDNVPDDILLKTSEIYAECLKKITG
ncbi:MAG: phosphoribosylaminoimidazolesuccinocarboxamide synthase [Treponema sp.]|jgi:phosphoribosylaminoimidazole-succinocarboxamide synthase|nr:phosphoribosylaminoimidazolesuccinocarboxamide synthase [Treponema sp.]